MQDRSLITIGKILDAARTLFINKPYADVSLKEISEKAGVTKGAIYYHFETKESLYSYMMLHYLEKIEESTRSSLEKTEGEPIEVRMYVSLLEFLELPDEMIQLVALTRRNSNIFQGKERAKLIEAYQAALPNQLEVIFKEAVDQGEVVNVDPRLMTWQYFALVEVSIHPYGRKMLGGREALARFVVSSFANGIKRRLDEPTDPEQSCSEEGIMPVSIS